MASSAPVAETRPISNEELRQVLARLKVQTATLNQHDAEIHTFLRGVQDWLLGLGITRVHAVPWQEAQLAWSGAKGKWRLIIRDGDSVTPLLQASRIEMVCVLKDGILRKLLAEMGLVK